MNTASVVVLAVVVGLAALAVWRNCRKGAPCECGCDCKSHEEGCCCHRC